MSSGLHKAIRPKMGGLSRTKPWDTWPFTRQLIHVSEHFATFYFLICQVHNG